MRHLLSRSLALLLCLSLLIGFSATANAELVQGYHIRQDAYVMIGTTGAVGHEWFSEFTPHDGVEQKESYTFDSHSLASYTTGKYFYRNVWNIFADSTFSFKLGVVNKVELQNFYYAYLLHEGNSNMHYVRDISELDEVYTIIEYADGTTERINLTYSLEGDYSIDMAFQWTPTKNVTRFTVIIDSDILSRVQATSANTRIAVEAYFGEFRGDDTHDFIVDIQSEEAGLLNGILGWIKNIFNKIGDTFAKVSEIANSILQLPTKLWAQISQGLKDLFIPSQEDMENFSTSMDTLLENKLGAVYEVSNILTESWDRIQASDETDTIEFPAATIPLPDGNEFTFGGYQVQIVPEGFTIVSTAVKTITGIACTVACINGLRKRYDEIMGG